MIETLLLHKAFKKKKEKYTTNEKDDNKMTTAQSIVYLAIMIISGVHAYKCYEGVEGRWWRVVLAILFPIVYLLLSAFRVTNCGQVNNNYTEMYSPTSNI